MNQTSAGLSCTYIVTVLTMNGLMCCVLFPFKMASLSVAPLHNMLHGSIFSIRNNMENVTSDQNSNGLLRKLQKIGVGKGGGLMEGAQVELGWGYKIFYPSCFILNRIL